MRCIFYSKKQKKALKYGTNKRVGFTRLSASHFDQLSAYANIKLEPALLISSG